MNIVVQNAVVAGEPPLVPGSRVAPCYMCGRDLWVPPSSERVLADGLLVCLPCGLVAAALASGEAVEFARVPGADFELRGAGHGDVADQDRALMRRLRRGRRRQES